jgi:hypothetical protein
LLVNRESVSRCSSLVEYRAYYNGSHPEMPSVDLLPQGYLRLKDRFLRGRS